jgi:DNA primase
LIAHLAQSGVSVDWVLRGPGLPAEAGAAAQPKEALDAFWQIFGYMRGEAELVEDLGQARAAWVETNDPAAQTRLIRLAGALDALRRGEAEEAPEGGEGAAK